MAKNALLTKTMVDPVGKLNAKDANMPSTTADMEMMIAKAIVCLNPRFNCKAVTVGNMIKLDMSIVPTTRIPNTMVMDVNTASIRDSFLGFLPITTAYSSSYVSAKRS